MSLLSIDAPHFNAAISVKDGKVVETAPILRYMIGWTVTKVRNYCGSKGWTVVHI